MEKKNLAQQYLKSFQKCCRRAGIKTNEKLCQHSMRKSWATKLANAGVPIKTLMKLGGWSSIECCQEYYLKTTDANEQPAVNVLNNIFVDKNTGQEQQVSRL